MVCVPRHWLLSGSDVPARVPASGVATELSSLMRHRTLSLRIGIVAVEYAGTRGVRARRATYDARSALQYTGPGVSHICISMQREKADKRMRAGLRLPTTSWNGMKMIRPGSAANWDRPLNVEADIDGTGRASQTATYRDHDTCLTHAV